MLIPLLESGQSPVPGKIYRLVETFSDVSIVDDPYSVSPSIDEATGNTTLVERKVGEGLMTLRGVFQRSDVKNGNKRTYPRSIWEKWLREDSPLMVKVRGSTCCGQIEHPKDGVGVLEDYACMVTNLSLEKDGTVIGEMKVLDTPKGRIVRDLVRSGVRVGVSSRGTGSVDSNGVVDERSFKPDTWDVVGNPSTPGAFPEVVESSKGGAKALSEAQSTVRTLIEGGSTVWEVLDKSNRVVRRFTANVNVNKPGDSRMSKERFNELRTHIAAHMAADVSESGIADLTALDNALTESSITIGTLVQQDGALKAVADDLQKQISEKRETIRAEMEERKKSGKGVECDDDEDEDYDEDEESSDESALTDPATVAEAIACLKAARAEITSLTEKVESQEDAINTLAEKVAETEMELAEAYEQCAAANSVIAEMTSQPSLIRAPVEDAVTEAIAKNPLLRRHQAALDRCQTVEEVASLVEGLTPRGIGGPRVVNESALPPIGGGMRNSLTEQTIPMSSRTGGFNSPKPGNLPRGIALVESTLNRQYGKPASVNG